MHKKSAKVNIYANAGHAQSRAAGQIKRLAQWASRRRISVTRKTVMVMRLSKPCLRMTASSIFWSIFAPPFWLYYTTNRNKCQYQNEKKWRQVKGKKACRRREVLKWRESQELNLRRPLYWLEQSPPPVGGLSHVLRMARPTANYHLSKFYCQATAFFLLGGSLCFYYSILVEVCQGGFYFFFKKWFVSVLTRDSNPLPIKACLGLSPSVFPPWQL